MTPAMLAGRRGASRDRRATALENLLEVAHIASTTRPRPSTEIPQRSSNISRMLVLPERTPLQNVEVLCRAHKTRKKHSIDLLGLGVSVVGHHLQDNETNVY